MHPCVARLACSRACAGDSAGACCTAALKDGLWWTTVGRLLLCGGGGVDQLGVLRGVQADSIRRAVVRVQGGECGAVRGAVCQHRHALSAGPHTPHMWVCVVVWGLPIGGLVGVEQPSWQRRTSGVQQASTHLLVTHKQSCSCSWHPSSPTRASSCCRAAPACWGLRPGPSPAVAAALTMVPMGGALMCSKSGFVCRVLVVSRDNQVQAL